MYVILSKSDHIWIQAEILKPTSEWMSECLLFNAKRTICQPYHGENTLYFNEMTIMSDLYWINMLSWNFIVLSFSLSYFVWSKFATLKIVRRASEKTILIVWFSCLRLSAFDKDDMIKHNLL